MADIYKVHVSKFIEEKSFDCQSKGGFYDDHGIFICNDCGVAQVDHWLGTNESYTTEVEKAEREVEKALAKLSQARLNRLIHAGY